MPKRCEANERLKRDYITYLEEVDGKDTKSTDKVLDAMLRFETSTGFKPFKKFTTDQAKRFKKDLARTKNERTGKPLSHATIDATLRIVKAFFVWLASQPGYKSVVTYADCGYFNNSAKNTRIAHAQRDIPYPSKEQAARAFEVMPIETDIQRRDKAIFALFMLTGIRDGAAASLRLKHINLAENLVFQDGREVKTKNGKTIYTWFFPVDPMYRESLADWVNYLLTEKLFADHDALFPKQRSVNKGNGFEVELTREPYADAGKLRAAVSNAFMHVQLPIYGPHSLRKTLGVYANEVCKTLEEHKAWSLNLGHEHLATTVNAYMPVNTSRQRELIRAMCLDATRMR